LRAWRDVRRQLRAVAASARPSEFKQASRNDASLFKAEIAVSVRRRGPDNHMIDELQLEDSACFQHSAGGPQVSFGRARIATRMVVDHDEGVSAEGNDRFENLPWVRHRFVQGPFADCDYLDKLLLGIEKNDS
jgi:hypothetical protein